MAHSNMRKEKGIGQMLAEFDHKKVVVGSKQLRKALEQGRATFVVLACDADPAITEPIEAICRQKHIRYAWIRSKKDLGKHCGIDVAAAAAAAVD